MYTERDILALVHAFKANLKGKNEVHQTSKVRHLFALMRPTTY